MGKGGNFKQCHALRISGLPWENFGYQKVWLDERVQRVDMLLLNMLNKLSMNICTSLHWHHFRGSKLCSRRNNSTHCSLQSRKKVHCFLRVSTNVWAYTTELFKHVEQDCGGHSYQSLQDLAITEFSADFRRAWQMQNCVIWHGKISQKSQLFMALGKFALFWAQNAWQFV